MSDAKGTVRTVDRETGLLCKSSRAAIEREHGIELPVRERIDWRVVLRR